jgi:quercetin dioxygenase-like cupin family protein
MNAEKIISHLEEEFPGKAIIAIPTENPKEILCELEKSEAHSVTIAYIDQSVPHYHTQIKEKYQIEQGSLVLNEAGREIELKEGEEYAIYPPLIHSAKGKATRVRVTSTPKPWTPEDHILAL